MARLSRKLGEKPRIIKMPQHGTAQSGTIAVWGDIKLEELDQKIRVLDRKIEIDKEAAAEKAKTTGGVTADKSGFAIKSADGAYRLRIGGYAQLDNRLFLDEKQRSTVDTFILRRVRPILEGTVAKIFDFRIMPDFGAGQTVLQDAYVEGKFSPAFRVRAVSPSSPNEYDCQ